METSTGADVGRLCREGGGSGVGRDALWVLRRAEPADVEAIVEIRAAVMRPDLERLGRFDAHRVRQRFRDAFSPAHTSVVVADGAVAGCVALRPAEDGYWLEHFYLAPALQGRGVGSAVLRTVLGRADADGMPVRLNVLRGSAAQRLYERHGFTLQAQDPVDVFMVREPSVEPHRIPGPGVPAPASASASVSVSVSRRLPA